MTQPTTTTDRTALVTGAARGIGLATTKSFLAAGWRVAMIDRDAPASPRRPTGSAAFEPSPAMYRNLRR